MGGDTRGAVNYMSVCSGIEAATVAWHPLGWKPLAFSEIDKFPSAVLKHYYPDVPNRLMYGFGGSFVQALAKLYLAADTSNRAILKDAFGFYFAEYRELARHKARQAK